MENDKVDRPVWFPQWAEALPHLRLPALRHQQYRTAIIQYLRFCKQTGQKATVVSARAIMQEVTKHRHLAASQLALWKEALNWFFKEAGKHPKDAVGWRTTSRRGRTSSAKQADATERIPPSVMTDVPSLAATDTGATEWEQRLIERLRTGHSRWSTEQAYRHWAGRFVRWLEGRAGGQASRRAEDWGQLPGGSDGASPSTGIETATEAGVKEFLSQMATTQRASASSQKQALNAIVFLLREVGHKDVATTQIYTHVMRKPGLGVKSPLDV